MKKCSKCNEIKALMEFYKDKKTKDGHCQYCKVCFSKQMKKYRQQNKEAIRERGKEYRQQNKEAIRERMKKYRQQNKEAIRERGKEYRHLPPQQPRCTNMALCRR